MGAGVEHLEAPDVEHPRWFGMFIDDCWSFYSYVRRRAGARADQPECEPAVAAPLPRAIERQLRPYRVVRVEARPQWPIAMQASETLRRLWENMRDRGVVVWFDNCYKPRYVYYPLRIRGSMNATAVSVLAIRTIPSAPEWYTVSRPRPPSLRTLYVLTPTYVLYVNWDVALCIDRGGRAAGITVLHSWPVPFPPQKPSPTKSGAPGQQKSLQNHVYQKPPFLH